MRKYLTLTNFPIILSLLVVLLTLPAAVFLVQQEQEFRGKAAIPETATLSLETTKTSYQVGETFNVDIRLDTGTRTIPTTGADVILGYEESPAPVTTSIPALEETPPPLLGVIEPLTITLGVLYDTYPVQNIDKETKTITISGSASSLDNYFAGNGIFASIQFRAAAPGDVKLSFYWKGPTATDDTNVVGIVNGQPQERLVEQPSSLNLTIVSLPTPTPTPVCKTGVNSFSVYNTCPGGFRNAKYICYDGTSGILGGPTSCKSSAIWREYAEKACEGRSSCPTPTPYPSPPPVPTPVPPAIQASLFGDTNHNAVYDEGEGFLTGFNVTIWACKLDQYNYACDQAYETRVAKTEGNAAVTFSSLPPGTYDVWIHTGLPMGWYSTYIPPTTVGQGEIKNAYLPLSQSPYPPVPTPIPPSPSPIPTPTLTPTPTPTPPPISLNFSLILEGRGACGFAADITVYGSYNVGDLHAFGPLGKTQTDITGRGSLGLGREHLGRTYQLFARTPSHLRKKASSAITIHGGDNYVDFGSLIPGDLFIAPGENEQDNLINNFDVAELFQKWGPTESSTPPAPADFNCDSIVNTWDLKILFENFGKRGDEPNAPEPRPSPIPTPFPLPTPTLTPQLRP